VGGLGEFLPGGHIPEPRGCVVAAGSQQTPIGTRACLARRSSFQPNQERGDHHHRLIVDRPLLEAGRDRAELLEAVEASLDHIPAPIALPVKGERPTRPAGTAGTLVGPLGNGVRDTTAAQQPPTPRVAVALVADQVVGSLAGPTPPARSWDRDGVKDRFQLGAVVALAGRKDHAQRPATPVAAEVDLGGQPAPGPAERLGLVMDDPPLTSPRAGRWRAPAACWWARTLVESTLTIHSSSPTASDLVWA
jgi:hypothetical protein